MSELKLGQDKKYLIEKARYEGLVVFLPEPNEVFLDLDLPDGKPNARVLQYIEESLKQDWEYSPDSSKGVTVTHSLQTVSQSENTHIYIRFQRPLTDLERVIFQVCLGSDPIKELFSFIQLKHIQGYDGLYCECPVAFFETPSEASKVIAWRSSLLA